jgi:hypothetical protein
VKTLHSRLPLTLDPADSEVDHPLVGLYRALRFSAMTNAMVYLSAEYKLLLAEAIGRLERQAKYQFRNIISAIENRVP